LLAGIFGPIYACVRGGRICSLDRFPTHPSTSSAIGEEEPMNPLLPRSFCMALALALAAGPYAVAQESLTNPPPFDNF
jgi:hypothetical protein